MRYITAAVAFILVLATQVVVLGEVMARSLRVNMRVHQGIKPLVGSAMVAIAAVAAVAVFRWAGR